MYCLYLSLPFIIIIIMSIKCYEEHVCSCWKLRSAVCVLLLLLYAQIVIAHAGGSLSFSVHTPSTSCIFSVGAWYYLLVPHSHRIVCRQNRMNKFNNEIVNGVKCCVNWCTRHVNACCLCARGTISHLFLTTCSPRILFIYLRDVKLKQHATDLI